MKPRVLVAGLFHETHSFLADRTVLDAFEKRGGQEMMDCIGDASPLGGVLESAIECGWEVIPALDWRATPGGMVPRGVLELFWKLLQPFFFEQLDGVFLVLHGAMVCEEIPDVEGELLQRIRDVVGMALPVFGVFDLHANFTDRMSSLANGLVGYRENPHVDARDSAVRAVLLMNRSLRSGERFSMVRHRVPVIWPPSGTATAVDPMLTLGRMARAAEREPGVFSVSVCAGYAYADTPDTGVSVVVVCRDVERAGIVARRIGMRAFEMRSMGKAFDLSKEEVRRRVLEHGARGDGVMVVAEQSDNIGGGAPGDGTGLLSWFLEWSLEKALVAIRDPEAVETAMWTGVGASADLSIGGKASASFGAPVRGQFEVVRLGEGRFKLEDPNSHLASMCGDYFDMGRCAVVRCGGVTVLLTSRKTPPFDLGQWRSQGIEPCDFDVIGVKAAVAHRRAYDPIAAEQLWADTPGPCSGNVRVLPYQAVRRPVYPLDADFCF